MEIALENGQTIDTARDLTAAERHILQKLFLWKPMAGSLEEFRQQTRRALLVGWNDSGPVRAGHLLKMIIEDLERQVVSRINNGL